ncbi:hypothetical protein [Streptomyces sp. SP18CS02]|uniref:hypothetical protein n=1 Tax=Streptomyces sp. SP18CS02 TaxID=3002531 RepID=UPI002E776444|nr:hypothetical protein [Streptomyces sp. SP18CS02]MEE1754777.1 hypothetical protein [Streptomyces sp. SP18CS02]
MPARTHTRSRTAATGGVDVRLPWWAVALPVLGFVTLFLLITGPGEAHAAGADPSVGRFLEQIQRTLSR